MPIHIYSDITGQLQVSTLSPQKQKEVQLSLNVLYTAFSEMSTIIFLKNVLTKIKNYDTMHSTT